MKQFLENLFGIEVVQELGKVDEYKLGLTTYSNTLSVVKINGALNFEFALSAGLSKKSFLWPFDPNFISTLQEEFQRISTSFSGAPRASVRGHFLRRIALRLSGYKVIADLGAIHMAANGLSSGAWLLEKMGQRFLGVIVWSPKVASQNLLPFSLQGVRQFISVLGKIKVSP
jgi:hypothetical protein